MPNGEKYPYLGKITFADPSFNPATGTFLLRASVQNPEGLLRPNQHVRARIQGAIRPKAVLIPQRSVQQGARGNFVWVVSDGKAEVRPVAVSAWHGDDWFVDDGLKAGEQVVVDGGLTLRPEVPVKVIPATPATPAKPAAPARPGTPAAAPAKTAG